MKIILITSYRTGSNSLLDWLGEELNLKIFRELEEVTIEDNYIVKKTLEQLTKIDPKEYDYIIKLFRYNTLLQAESNVFAKKTSRWRGNDLNEKYFLDDQFLYEHHDEIISSKNIFDDDKKHLTDLPYGFMISYEELFYHESGQRLIESYIGFTAKNKLMGNDKKFRAETYKSNNLSLEIEIEKLKNEINNLNITVNLYKHNNNLISNQLEVKTLERRLLHDKNIQLVEKLKMITNQTKFIIKTATIDDDNNDRSLI
jgi:hypothetical protein